MRDSALKLAAHKCASVCAAVGEELMRDSALKHVVADLLVQSRRESEKSSCATAL